MTSADRKGLDPANRLYHEYANLYTQMADDRDFSAELEQMGVTQVGDATFVELFAGPAFHATTLGDSNWTGHLIAVDISREMEEIARQRGYAGRYLCSDALTALKSIQQVEFICIPRFSIVLVDQAYLAKLFLAAAEALRTNGLFFVEIHKDSVVNDNTPVGGDWESLTIYRRTRKISGATVDSLWPYTTEVIDPDKNVVRMSVRVIVTPDAGAEEELDFYSIEHLHPRSAVLAFAAEAGLALLDTRCFETQSGYFLAFGFPSREDPIADFVGFDTSELTRRAMTRLFDLTSDANRQYLLSKSGLDVNSHDSPLSLHVYNLL